MKMKKTMKPNINTQGNIEVRLEQHVIEVHGETGKLLSSSPGLGAQDLFHMLALARNYAPEKKEN